MSFVNGTVVPQEGTTQEDPLAILMYALATVLLIKKLEGNWKQMWYADNAAATGIFNPIVTGVKNEMS